MSDKPVILYADDDPDDREMLAEYILLNKTDYEIVEVENGREALLYLRSTKGLRNPPALIILDLNMPVLTGRETLAIMKSEPDTENLLVVVLTTSTSERDAEFCRKFGVQMISKPTTVQGIENTVQQLLSILSSENAISK